MATLYVNSDYYVPNYTLDDIYVDWPSKVILIPRVAMTLVQTVPTVIYELNLVSFHLTLRDLEDNEEAMTFAKTHVYTGPVNVGGVTLASVVTILDPYTITFEDGQYAVNLVGANSNVGDRVNVNQVSVRSANSAGLVQTSEIEYSSFQNVVTLDVVNGEAGQSYPIGTVQRPVNNLVDAQFIAALRGLDTVSIKGDYEFDPADSIDRFTIVGQSPSKTLINLTGAASITNCEFLDATIFGELDGGNDISQCHIGTLNYIDGTIKDCELEVGTITLAGNQAEFVRCWSGVAGAGQYPILDMGGTGTDLVIRDWHGGLGLQNHTSGTDDVSIDMSSGTLTFDPTIETGVYTVRGIGSVIDNSTGSAVVHVDVLDSHNLNRATFSDASVYLDQGSVNSGTIFPTGTPSKPVNNMADAIDIANEQGLTKIALVGFFALNGTEVLDGITVVGGSGSSNVLGLTSGVSTDGAGFERLIVYGELGGLSRIVDCVLGVTGLGGFTECEGRVVNCIINSSAGVIQKTAGAGTLFDNCSFIAPNDPQIVLDANDKAFSLRKCTGNILVQNATAAEDQQIHLQGGQIEFDNSCTAGAFSVTGTGYMTDNSAVGCTVTDMTTTHNVDATVEAVAPPSATATLGEKNAYMYALTVNKTISDGTTQRVRDSSDTIDISSKDYAESGGTLTVEKSV